MREVKGTIRFADASFAAGLKVLAVDRNLRSEDTLGDGRTGRDGAYRIQYVARAKRKSRPGLVVKVYDADGSVLAASPTLFNAPPSAVVDITIPAEVRRPPSQFETIGQTLEPLLKGVAVTQLEESAKQQDLSFLASETGLDKTLLARFALAHRLAQKDLPPEFWFVLLGGAFFKWTDGQSVAEQLATLSKSLPSLDAPAAQKSLARGFNLNEIASAFQKKSSAWIKAFAAYVAQRMVGATADPSFLQAALDHAGVRTAAKREAVANLFLAHRALTPEAAATLEKDRTLTKAQSADIQTSFQLADLTGAAFDVVKMVKEHFDIRRPDDVPTLAKQPESEWVKVVKTSHTAGEITLPVEVGKVAGNAHFPAAQVYGKALARQVREAFPTMAFAGGLERALKSGDPRGVGQAKALSGFLGRHPDFELLTTPIDGYVDAQTSRADQALAKDDDFRQSLKAVQRVFKLAPVFEATDALLADGLHSAQQIYRLGESEFVRRYGASAGFTAQDASRAWRRAADTHAAVLTIIGDLKSLDSEALPQVLQNGNAALATFPNWNNLFQAGDICECQQCRSVLGPAAYFADLLTFLKDRRAKNPAQSVKDILFGRRPDLGYLELNCDNALVPLPYVDVVCEVLEAVVDAAGENDVELAGFAAMPADPVAAKAAVAAAFAAQQISLGADFSLSQVTAADPNRWVAHGEDATYLLKKKATPNFFAQVLPNTKATAEELRAYPQYVNPKAYNTLRAAKYPLALPFDLFAEEVRAAFDKCHLQRWDLMQTLRGTAAPNDPSDGDIAAEYFGISADPTAAFDEKRLILVADATVAGQQTVWGETGNAAWLTDVGNVKVFLQKTSQDYTDLFALLDLKFINPAGDMFVHHLDPSCDTDKKTIEALDAIKLDRIHRFLRLWRKLDRWKMWELDLVIRHSGIGNGTLDEPFLVKLFFFCEVMNRLGGKASVEQTCALFGDLNTDTRFTQVHEKRDGAIYQSLFLNKKLVSPLDPAFALDPGTGDLPTGDTITAHRPVILAALGIREADLIVFEELTRASDGTVYITDDLTLATLSFLWRHSWLSRRLKFKADEWKTLLKVVRQDLLEFAGPEDAWTFLVQLDALNACGFTPDDLNWLLAADRSARAATKEADATRFLSSLRKDLQAIKSQYDPAAAPADVDGLTTLLTSLLQKLQRDQASTQFFVSSLRNEVQLEKQVAGLPANFDFPAAIKNSIAIRYDQPATTLHFTGVMTAAEQTTLLTVSGIAAYQEAIGEFFNSPRLALKFYEPTFTAPLASLPAGVTFKSLPDASLALKISFDADVGALRFAGIMTSDEEGALDALSADPDYLNAVSSLANQPGLVTPPDPRIWLLDSDLHFPLAGELAANLTTAVTRALAYLSNALSVTAVVQQSSAQLGLTEALTRHLLTDYALLPDTLLAHLTGTFAATTGVVDRATLTPTFDRWYWLNRAAAILKKWKITTVEWEEIVSLTASANLLDLLTLPLNDAGAIAPIDRFLRTGRLLRLRDGLPEAQITLLEVLGKLAAGTYATAADFAADVERLNEAWSAADVEALVAAINLTYPADYLLAESWERLRRAFYFLDSLNAGAATVVTFAASAMTPEHAKTIKALLRSKFGTDTWLELSAQIQDVLRERKRDALAAWLLSQPQPADAPSGKWDDTNDLYAYYLLDVEMCSCLLTSRLVQASGSVQLLVQRCFMGLEPAVAVKADGTDGDSAWRWWTWMRKYQVWVANRKVFLWPENWIEPELKADRSPFFKELEQELLQNDVTEDAAETALTHYLEKLDGVAQLEIAGFYQEDDGDNAIVHVFARTPGADPHLYYYRRYDYRQWTAWEPVDLDIQGDYLVPAVVNNQLFLFWPVFSEVPDEESNSNVAIPSANQGSFTLQKTAKKSQLRLAVSKCQRSNQRSTWAPKKVSKEFYESTWTNFANTVPKFYEVIPVDRSDIDGRFLVSVGGYSLGEGGYEVAELFANFEVGGCTGVPELVPGIGNFKPVVRPEWASVGQYNPDKSYSEFMKWNELGRRTEFGAITPRHDAPQNDFTLENTFAPLNGARFTTVLLQTPWLFRMTPPWQLSYLDRLLLDGLTALGTGSSVGDSKIIEFPVPIGTWLPFFYNDKKRTFFVLPVLGQSKGQRLVSLKYYPDVKRQVEMIEAQYAAQVQSWLANLNLLAFTSAQRQSLDQLVWNAFPGEAPPPLPGGSPPPYNKAEADQVKGFLQRYLMRYFHGGLGSLSLQLFQSRRFLFKNFYHPFVCDFIKLISNPLKAIPALMSRETQLQDSGFSFRQQYQPTDAVVDPSTEAFYPRELVDFTPDGAYAPYNWELFFHAPLLIANSLSRNQRFEEARDWYHFIFNPIGMESAVPGGSPMSKYWITKPFFETTDTQYVQQRIENILRMLAGDTTVDGFSAQAKAALEGQVLDWRTHPFEPHRIANYRTVAYEKTVVMKYLDNLIAWGDNLFRQDSMESTSEATQLYIMAAEILGPRPMKIPPQAKPPEESFNELEDKFDSFSNALIEVENLIPPLSGNGANGGDQAPLPMLYFCIPQNDKLLGYWDTVADRLFKLRHCMNIDGVVRQLPLFEPPIDPGALVKAVAAGVDIGSALADLNAPLPLYRFNVLLQKANEVCNDVKSLGGALLAVLEKKDAEELGLLRQRQEIRLLEAVRAVREKQLEEANETLEGTKKSKELAAVRKQYYESRDFMNLGETTGLGLNILSVALGGGIEIGKKLVAVLRLVPDFILGASGFGGSPHAVAQTGGDSLSESGNKLLESLEAHTSTLDKAASLSNTMASYQRRQDDWGFQLDLANKELEQLDRQIAAAELRVAIAQQELDNHDVQIANAQETDAFMHAKYTNLELFQWQVGQISGVYFQSYQLAYDLAKKAERCSRFELGLQDSSYIQFGYWDSLKKGLLSGETLQYDLRRLESAYLEQNRREFELTKSISLLLLDPLALVRLRETGRCFVNLPEEIFDLDYPGHYFRRVKSVSVTIPAVLGQEMTCSFTLRLLKNSIRINTTDGDNGYPRNADDQGLPTDDDRFVENNIPVKNIATSSAQNDSGVFELSFRDERYLPFEGAGVISSWALELFNDLPSNNPDPANPDFGKPLRQFDYRTISDAILHVKYTAREDAGPFKNSAVTHLRDYFSQNVVEPSVRMLSLRQEFPTQWQRFLNPADPANGNVFDLEISARLFPFRDDKKTLTIDSIWLLARGKDGENYTVVLDPPLPATPAGSDTFELVQLNSDLFGRLHFAKKEDVSTAAVSVDLATPPNTWHMVMTNPANTGGLLKTAPAEVEDVFLVLGYRWG